MVQDILTYSSILLSGMVALYKLLPNKLKGRHAVSKSCNNCGCSGCGLKSVCKK